MSKDCKKIELSTEKILTNHLNAYICVHKYRENAYNVTVYGHNSFCLRPAAMRKDPFRERRTIPQYAY